MTQIATHLSQNFLETLSNSPNRKMEAILQILKIQNSSEKKNSIQVTLSDGYFSLDFLLITQKAPEFAKVKELDIIECRVLYYNSRNLRVIFDFKLLYKNLDEIIGNPIPYDQSENKINNSGSNQIPQKILRTTQSYQTQDKINVEITGQNGEKRVLQGERVEKLQKSELIDKKYYTDIINLYVSEQRFRIRGSVQRKSKMREFNKRDKDEKGHVFSCVINDGTRELQISFFNEDALKFYDILERGKNYSFVNGNLRSASRYNNTSNKIEMICSNNTEIKTLPDGGLKKHYYSIVPLKQIKNLEAYKIVDVLGIITSVEEKRTITFKDGRESEIRNVSVRDNEAMINVSLWGDLSQFEFKMDNIYLFQNLMVKDYQGKSLSSNNESEIISNIPDLQEYRELLISQKKGGQNLKIENLTTTNEDFGLQIFPVNSMVDNAHELVSEPMIKRFYTVIANLTHVPTKIFYDSCHVEDCKRKVLESNTGKYNCGNCKKDYDKPKHRFIGNLKFSDDSGSFYCLIAGVDQCRMIFGKEEEELYNFQNINEDNNIFFEFIHSKLFRMYKMRIGAKVEFYNDKESVKFNCRSIKSVSNTPEFYAEKLFDLLEDEKKDQ